MTCAFAKVLIWVPIVSHAQDVEQIAKEDPVKVSGGLSVNTTAYTASGIENRRDPFFWQINSNLNFDILGIIQAPFSLSISQQNKNFAQAQPFNRFGISPKYKWLTLHLGHRSMRFSDYTLAGNLFLGAGVDVNKKDSFVRFSAMWGRFAKPVNRTAQSGLVFARPTFRRTGWGFKVGLGREKHNVDLILFTAKDDPNSIQITDTLEISPEENAVFGIVTTNEITDRISFEAEFAHSLFTRDANSPTVTLQQYSFVNNFGGLFEPNSTSEFNNAFRSAMTYAGQGYQLNIGYKRVDPGFRTLGSSFLNNDLEDITAGAGWNMFSGKVNMALNGGVQRNNLDDQLLSRVRRIIYSTSVNYAVSERLNVASNYANFSTTTRQSQLRRELLADSLEYFQVTRSGGVNLNYQTNGELVSHNLFLNTNIQDATDSEDNSSTFYNLTGGHQVRIAQDWGLTTSYTMNHNKTAGITNVTTGPILAVNRSLLQGKIRTTLSTSLLNAYMAGDLESRIVNVRWVNNLQVGKSHNFSLSSYYLNRDLQGEDPRTISELRVSMNYGYRFNKSFGKGKNEDE